MKHLIESVLPRTWYRALTLPYHLGFTIVRALQYGFPAKKLTVIGVTGTKGKSSVTEMLAAILEAAGHTVAVSSTIRFKTGATSKPNLFKMTLPGRGFIQKFLAEAVDAKCDFAIIEVTSEAALQYRHLFLEMNALVFTNLQKEHLESHGGIENYFRAKLAIGEALVRSKKRPRIIVANADDEYGRRFLKLPVDISVPFSHADAKKVHGGLSASFMYGDTPVKLHQPGIMNVMNALAAMKTAQAFGVSAATSAGALSALTRIPGRAEEIDAGQDFLVVVDYAHTPDSLSALYEAYKDKRKICVLGNTGGGRDTWKRPAMGKIADEACAHVILTDEDPYDEDPKEILNAMAQGMKRAPHIILDRRTAIREALVLAQPGDAVLISGKGTDPYIMRAGGAKEAWSDAQVVRKELEKMRA